MESTERSNSATVVKVAKPIIPILLLAIVCFVFITALFKPVYSPMVAYLIIIGATVLCAVISAILLILDYGQKEVE
jgi:hypothetical protein